MGRSELAKSSIITLALLALAFVAVDKTTAWSLESAKARIQDAQQEVSSATEDLTKEPLTPESAATWMKVVGSQLLRGAAVVALPARMSLQASSAALLLPLSTALLRHAQTAPNTTISQACQLLEVRFPCPEMLLVDSDSVGLQTLPLLPPTRLWGVFVSRALVAKASQPQLLALLLREVALLQMRVPPLPQLWAVLAAIKGKAKTRRAPTHSKTHRTFSQLQRARIQELCRVHRGLSEVQARHDQLPLPLQAPVTEAARHLLLPGVLGDCVNVVGTYADRGVVAAVQEAGSDVADYIEDFQLLRLVRIARLNVDVFGKPKRKPLTKTIHETRVNLQRVYSIGPKRVEGLLKAASKVRHPTRVLRQRRRPKLPFFEIWTACTAMNRAATLLADHQAAKAMGSIDHVAGGLVLLHGTPLEQRRLRRGDIRGLLEDAQSDLPVRRRWPHWLGAFIKAGLQPASSSAVRCKCLLDCSEKRHASRRIREHLLTTGNEQTSFL
ncbi:MCA1 [Symbiodinium natans]|uniref:MCA1 protein n=1 Tax=Symbiodinium natans TaxID=878477 RepID=A0A812J7I2_9DINO|nr:MCA1 [Symbiodinium natans]